MSIHTRFFVIHVRTIMVGKKSHQYESLFSPHSDMSVSSYATRQQADKVAMKCRESFTDTFYVRKDEIWIP